MMYRCIECGHIFESGEEGILIDSFPYGDTEVDFENECCPKCRGDFEEVKHCLKCGALKSEEELLEDICEECINSYKNDYKMCLKASRETKEEVPINAFLAYRFSPEMIESILEDYLNSEAKIIPIDCTYFIESDRSWFASKIREDLE